MLKMVRVFLRMHGINLLLLQKIEGILGLEVVELLCTIEADIHGIELLIRRIKVKLLNINFPLCCSYKEA